MKATYQDLKVFLIIVLIVQIAICCTEKPEPFSDISSEMDKIVLLDGSPEFSAVIHKPGKSKILEYGFLIGLNQDPAYTYNDAIKISQIGEIKTGYSLKTDQLDPGNYIVRAFLRSSSGTFYSPEVEFLYSGSSIETSMEIYAPSEAYFGDMIKIYMKDTGMTKADYYAEINGTAAEIVQIENDYFNFAIPEGIDFTMEPGFEKISPENLNGSIMKISYMTPSGLITKHKQVNFKYPIFHTVNELIPSFPLHENWVLNGAFLKDINLKVKITGSDKYLKIVSATENQIIVEPSEGLDEKNPSFIVTLRGKEYILAYYINSGWPGGRNKSMSIK